VTVPIASEATLKALGDLAAEAGLRRIHMLAWRDLDDVEAGGSEVHAHHVASLWAQAGIEVLHRTSYAAGHRQRIMRDGYEVTRKAGRYMVFPRSVAAELAGRNGVRDGLVEIWNGVPFMSPLWCRGPRAVWLHHVHGPMWEMTLPKNPGLARMGHLLEERIAPKFYRRAPIITLSSSSKAELVEELGFKERRITVVPPGVDPKFSPGGRRSATPLVLAVGRLVPVKDFPRLVRVMARVHESVPDARLVIVGEGYERDKIRSTIRDHDADEWVTLAGRVDDASLVDLYRCAWAVGSTSVREGWGMTVTEGAACGTPCVATRIAGHLDAVVDGQSGLLADSDDELVDAFRRVLTDGDLRQRLTDGALRRGTELSWSATAVGTLRVLADDSLRRRRPARR
jgi:glycosyltransferase involved in cell wall biosynthesis